LGLSVFVNDLGASRQMSKDW